MRRAAVSNRTRPARRRFTVVAAICAALALLIVSPLRADSFLDEPTPEEQTALQEPGSSANAAAQDRASGAMTGPADGSAPAHLGLAGNPGAVNIRVGRGTLGKLLGISDESGWRLGGLWIGDASGVLAGGLRGGHWGLNNLVIVDVFLDAEKEFGWTGASFGTQYLDYTGQPTNILAGSVQGFDGIQGDEPFNRSEWYQLWWRQEWFDGKLITRVGKSVPTYDFNNVLAAVPVDDQAYNIPAVSGLIYSPIFINPTMFRRLPGYYDSATGVVASLAPNEHFYMTYGFFDGNAAAGDTTGTLGPQFTGYYFHIGEVGACWQAGPLMKPGKCGVGVWGQTGLLRLPSGGYDEGETGVYFFGSQRLWFRHPGVDNSGVSGFVQWGANDSNASLVRQYFGCGLTAFSLINSRPRDTQGVGLAWAWLNSDPEAGTFFYPKVQDPVTQLRSNELMLQGYYQAILTDALSFQPTLSYIPNPGVRENLDGAFALSMYLVGLF